MNYRKFLSLNTVRYILIGLVLASSASYYHRVFIGNLNTEVRHER